jgi:hypothetical protein
MPHLHPLGHDLTVKIGHLSHDKRFWFAVGIAVLATGLLALLIWASLKTSVGLQPGSYHPMFPTMPK